MKELRLLDLQFFPFNLEFLLPYQRGRDPSRTVSGFEQELDELLHEGAGLVLHEASQVELHLLGTEGLLLVLGLLQVRHYVRNDNLVPVTHQLRAPLLHPRLQRVQRHLLQVNGLVEALGPAPGLDELFVLVLEFDVLVELRASEKLRCHLLIITTNPHNDNTSLPKCAQIFGKQCAADSIQTTDVLVLFQEPRFPGQQSGNAFIKCQLAHWSQHVRKYAETEFPRISKVHCEPQLQDPKLGRAHQCRTPVNDRSGVRIRAPCPSTATITQQQTETLNATFPRFGRQLKTQNRANLQLEGGEPDQRNYAPPQLHNHYWRPAAVHNNAGPLREPAVHDEASETVSEEVFALKRPPTDAHGYLFLSSRQVSKTGPGTGRVAFQKVRNQWRS